MRWALTAVLLIAALTGCGTSDSPHVRNPLRSGEAYGVDVSNHQGPFDWHRVARDGIAFAYLKASEGGDFTDSRFANNWQRARQAGVLRGAYHFFTLCRHGADQANNFLRNAPPERGTLPPAVDLS